MKRRFLPDGRNIEPDFQRTSPPQGLELIYFIHLQWEIARCAVVNSAALLAVPLHKDTVRLHKNKGYAKQSEMAMQGN